MLDIVVAVVVGKQVKSIFFLDVVVLKSVKLFDMVVAVAVGKQVKIHSFFDVVVLKSVKLLDMVVAVAVGKQVKIHSFFDVVILKSIKLYLSKSSTVFFRDLECNLFTALGTLFFFLGTA